MKLAKIIQSEKNDERRSKTKPINGSLHEHPEPLRRANSSPSLRSLQETSWSIGRGALISFISIFIYLIFTIILGKGGKKLGVGGGLIKSLPEKGFQEWTKMHKESTKKMIEKRKQNSSVLGGSPVLNKIRQKNKTPKTNRKFGN